MLLPANACGLLREGVRLSTCPRYHVASVTWLLSLACVACVAGLALFVWVTCCSQRPRPRFYGIFLGSVFLLFFCGLPYILYWTLHPILNLLLPVFLLLATLLACPGGRSSTSRRAGSRASGSHSGWSSRGPWGRGPSWGPGGCPCPWAACQGRPGSPQPFTRPSRTMCHPGPPPAHWPWGPKGRGHQESRGLDSHMPSLWSTRKA